MAPTWYFGPDWDMRPLACPQPDVDITTETYGGTFQGLSGARTRTYTGSRQRFVLTLTFLEPDEFEWLEYLNARTVPGPFRLLSPFKKNLLSRQASLVTPVPGFDIAANGFSVNAGVLTRVRAWPTGVAKPGLVAAQWVLNGFGRFDQRTRLPVKTGQPMTLSVYAKGTTAGTANLLFDWFDITGTQISTDTSAALTVPVSWTRLAYTATPPAGAVSVRPAMRGTGGATAQLAAAQVEFGSAATDWELGGGAPAVLLDQLSDTTSPRFPYVNTTLNLLEA